MNNHGFCYCFSMKRVLEYVSFNIYSTNTYRAPTYYMPETDLDMGHNNQQNRKYCVLIELT